MKKTVVLFAVAALGLAAVPSHAQGFVLNPGTILPTFKAILSDFSGSADDFVNVNAVDAANGATYATGQFGFDGANFQVVDLTQPTPLPGQPFFPDTTYNMTPELDFLNLTLTGTLKNGTKQSYSLFDVTDPNNPVQTDTLTLGSSAGLGFLVSDTPIPLSDLNFATLTGTFTDGSTPPNQNIPVLVAAVPEPGTDALLLGGLLLALAPALRARKARHAQS